MSEIGASLHFWRANHVDVKTFVAAQGATGRILASNARWTCFVPFDPNDEGALRAAWQGTVMKWSYSADYGLGLEFHRNGQIVGDASFIWGTDLSGLPPGGSFSADLSSHLKSIDVLSTESAADIENVIADIKAGTILGSAVPDRVAAVLDLAAFELLSPETCLEVGLEAMREDYPDAEDIEE